MHTGLFPSSLKVQLCSCILVFWDKLAAWYFLLGTQTVQFLLVRVTTGMAVNPHRTLSSDLFSHGMAQCVLGAYLQSSEAAGKTFLGNLGTVFIFLLWKVNICSLKPARKTHWFFSYHNKNLVKYLSFLTGIGCLPILARKYSHRTVSPNQDNKSYLYTGTLSPDFFLMGSYSVYLVYH